MRELISPAAEDRISNHVRACNRADPALLDVWNDQKDRVEQIGELLTAASRWQAKSEPTRILDLENRMP